MARLSVALPTPQPGLVISYAYLWRSEADQGRIEGAKTRPCVVILIVETSEDAATVTVAPITHTPPSDPTLAIELPAETKRRLGLDDQPSWVIAAELNRFLWPGVDLRPIGRDPTRFAYGLLPANLYRALRDKVAALARGGRIGLTGRDQ